MERFYRRKMLQASAVISSHGLLQDCTFIASEVVREHWGLGYSIATKRNQQKEVHFPLKWVTVPSKKHGILWGGKSLLNTTLRHGEIFIKRWREERKRTQTNLHFNEELITLCLFQSWFSRIKESHLLHSPSYSSWPAHLCHKSPQQKLGFKRQNKRKRISSPKQ